MNYDDLLLQAKNGSISQADVDAVARQLEADTSEVDVYTLLHILGRSNARRHRPLVEKYLYNHDDPMLARLGLQILCSWWDETPKYLEPLRAFAMGVAQDPDNDARLVALGIAGEHLRGHDDPELANIVVRAFEDVREDRNVREAAYRAIARAGGLDWSEVPPTAKHFNLNSEVRLDLIQRLRQRTARPGSEGRG